MRLLLDTHIALWVSADDERLSRKARALIADPVHDIFVSDAAIWEIAVKSSRAKPDPEFSFSPEEETESFEASGFEWIRIERYHLNRLVHLPRIHKDPFDRLLIAQSLCESMSLVTHNRLLARYSDSVILV